MAAQRWWSNDDAAAVEALDWRNSGRQMLQTINDATQRLQEAQQAVASRVPAAPAFPSLDKLMTGGGSWSEPEDEATTDPSGWQSLEALTSSWFPKQQQQPAPTPSGTPAAMPSNAPRTGGMDSTITTGPRPDQQLRPGESVGSVTLGDGASAGPPASGGDIDNSSRESFVRTAWPYALRAAGGNPQMAEMMLAKAISENGDIGKGGPIIGWNVSGIKGTGDAGSFDADTWESVNGQRVNIRDKFAAYSGPEAGFGAFMKFLQDNSRYHPALAEYQRTGNVEKLFDDVNAAGYATDVSWSQKLRNIRDSQVAPVVRGQVADNRQSMTAGADAVPPSAPAAPAGNGAPPTVASLHPRVDQAFKAANGRDPTAEEAQELRQAFGMMA